MASQGHPTTTTCTIDGVDATQSLLGFFDSQVIVEREPLEQLKTAPLISQAVKDKSDEGKTNQDSKAFPHCGLLGFHVGQHLHVPDKDPIWLNVNAPSSVFICGSQGSGKSYTLGCILENCLMSDGRIGSVTSPLAGVVFHYDSDLSTFVAEAAHLCSRGVRVQVLVSQSNEHKLRSMYESLPRARSLLSVKPLLLRPADLSVGRMQKLMAFADKEGPMPLYMETAQRILRQMAVQTKGAAFDYGAFKQALERENLTKEQLTPLRLRLDLLESFLASSSTTGKNDTQAGLQLVPGSLTVVDLSDPFLDPGTACVLFDIVLSLAKERRPTGGIVVALDEAHKYINKSNAAVQFMDRLLGTIREQRHNATRVIIATQEPTISGDLLDLCSVSIVHRFASPRWYTAIKNHLGGASPVVLSSQEQQQIFRKITELNTGESLVFAPSALLSIDDQGNLSKLGASVITMKTRKMLGEDGGASKLVESMDSDPATEQVVYKGRGECTVARPKGKACASPSTNSALPSNHAALDETKAHLVLICCACRGFIVIAYRTTSLPAYSGVWMGERKNGIAFGICPECRLSAGSSRKSVKNFDWVQMAAFRNEPLSAVEKRCSQAISGLVPYLGGTLQVLMHQDTPVYLLGKAIKSTLEISTGVWEAELESIGSEKCPTVTFQRARYAFI